MPTYGAMLVKSDIVAKDFAANSTRLLKKVNVTNVFDFQ